MWSLAEMEPLSKYCALLRNLSVTEKKVESKCYCMTVTDAWGILTMQIFALVACLYISIYIDEVKCLSITVVEILFLRHNCNLYVNRILLLLLKIKSFPESSQIKFCWYAMLKQNSVEIHFRTFKIFKYRLKCCVAVCIFASPQNSDKWHLVPGAMVIFAGEPGPGDWGPDLMLLKGGCRMLPYPSDSGV